MGILVHYQASMERVFRMYPLLRCFCKILKMNGEECLIFDSEKINRFLGFKYVEYSAPIKSEHIDFLLHEVYEYLGVSI